MKITEIKHTIQGEGSLQGTPSIFVRFKECNLNCVWCDSKNQNNYICLNVEELMKKIKKYNCKNIVITGGEPFLEKDLEILTIKLKELNFHITIETNGTIYRSVMCDLLSISPKLKHSNNRNCLNYEALGKLITNYNYQIKFVVRDEKDIEEISRIIKKLNLVKDERIMLMALSSNYAEIKDREKSVIKLCMKNNYRYADRLQLQIWRDEEENL